MDSAQATAHSFQFRYSPRRLERADRRKPRGGRRGPRATLVPPSLIPMDGDEAAHALITSTELGSVTIFIDKTVMDRDRLVRIARALGATLADRWGSAVTHVVHGPPQRNPTTQRAMVPRIISKSLDHKMRVVSPSWLLACYEAQGKLNETLYPYDRDSHDARTATLSGQSVFGTEDNVDNPFGIAPEELADTDDSDDDETQDDGRQQRVTDYFTRTGAPADPQQTGDSYENGFDMDGMGDDQPLHHPHDIYPSDDHHLSKEENIDAAAEMPSTDDQEPQHPKYEHLQQQQQDQDTPQPPPKQVAPRHFPPLTKQPRKTHGKEQRLAIWYGEQTLFYDADQQGNVVDLCSPRASQADPPAGAPSESRKRRTLTNLSTKRSKKTK
ncbi:hypothetical protein BC940DRAFT_295330 [Gongronella butleri]|nr:hypothetical protein BC940DRAFT_295330 [Gongronella butleri]